MKYIINIAVYSVGYLYIMDLITVTISMKQTRFQVSSSNVNVGVTQDL